MNFKTTRLFCLLVLLCAINIAAFSQTVSLTTSSTGCKSSNRITIKPSGFSGTPQFQLLDAATSVVLKPTAGNNFAYSTDSYFDGIPNGTYKIRYKDGNLGTPVVSSSVTVNDGYTNMKLSVSAPNVYCTTDKGTITLSVSGGRAPFSYTLTNGPSGSVTQIENAFAGLSAGTNYNFLVTDNCGETVNVQGTFTAQGVYANQLTTTGQITLIYADYLNCASPPIVRIEEQIMKNAQGVQLTTAERTHISWYINWNGNQYGVDAAGNSALLTTNTGPLGVGTGLPRGQSASGSQTFNDDVHNNMAFLPAPPPLAADPFAATTIFQAVFVDDCGNTKAFGIGRTRNAYSQLNFDVCGATLRAINVDWWGYALSCLPFTHTLYTKDGTNTIVQTFTQTESRQQFTGADIANLVVGETYRWEVKDAKGAIVYSVDRTIEPRTLGMQGISPTPIFAGYSAFSRSLNQTLRVRFFQSVSSTTSWTVTSANGGPLATGMLGVSGTLNAFNSTGGTTDMLLLSGKTGNLWPKGQYTIHFKNDCFEQDISFYSKAYDATLTSITTTPNCGTFNMVASVTVVDDPNTPENTYNKFELVILQAPNTGDIGKTAAVQSDGSAIFGAMNYGAYKIGLRAIGSAAYQTAALLNIFNTQDVTFNAEDAITIDASLTGGYVCNGGDNNGILTISATGFSALQYAIYNEATSSWTAYQTANTFSGLTNKTYSYRVKDECGNVITRLAQVTIASAPLATINGHPVQAEICLESDIQLDVDVVGATYLWSGPGITAANQNSKNPLITAGVLASGSYTYEVAVTTSCGVSESQVIAKINPTPVLVVTNPASVCSPATVDITKAEITTGSAVGLVYTYFKDETATTLLANPATIATSGTYYIKGTNAGNCIVVKPVEVVINALPDVPQSAGVTQPTCSISTGTIVIASPLGADFTYSINGTDFQTLPTFTNIPQGSYTISVKNNSGCVSSSASPIVINAQPTAVSMPIVTAGSSTTICNGSSVTLTSTIASLYQWYKDGSIINGATNQAYIATTAGSYNVMVTTGACSATSTGLTVNLLPNTTIALSSATGTNTQTKCISTAMSNVTYQVTNATDATVTGLPAGVTGSYAAGVFTISGTPTASGTFNYTVTATGACASTTATGTITVTPNTTIALSSGPGTDAQAKCVNTLITNISYTISNGLGVTVTGLPDGISGTYSNSTFTISGSSRVTGTFKYAVVATGNCQSETISGSITINPLPVIIVTSDLGLSISKGDVATLTATGGSSYNWTPSIDILSGQGTSILEVRPKQATTYLVTVTNASGCSEVMPITITVTDDYKLIPNNVITPNGDGKNDTWVIKNIDYYPNNTVKIFDRAGRLIYSKKGYNNEWDGTYNGNYLNEDAYIYVIDMGTGIGLIRGTVSIIRDSKF